MEKPLPPPPLPAPPDTDTRAHAAVLHRRCMCHRKVVFTVLNSQKSQGELCSESSPLLCKCAHSSGVGRKLRLLIKTRFESRSGDA